MIRFNTLQEFQQITGKNISEFFQKALNFFSNDYRSLSAYYAGKTSSIKSDPFARLAELESLSQVFFAAFHAHAPQLTNVKWWYLLEELENIDNRLRMIRNIHRWARSSRSNVSYLKNIELDYTMPAGQTLERISRDILESSNPQDEWTDIALRNNLREEDYSADGGVNLKLTSPVNNRNIQVATVVDTMQGKSMLGKDLHRGLQFVDNDLRCLGYDETVYQSVEILACLKKNDNPHAPSDGLQSAVIVGANRASLNFPIIVRQLSATFATDDTLQDFAVNEIKVVDDNLFISYQVKTRLNETIDGRILI
ncbi:hypothetical protein ACTJJ0_30810 [Chitinophaga sp. 22321]|uniref:Baseplate J-like protein n=1 Tax=Chitinophaga hostae TaxID=2831022 RepID=A0ABS5J8R8_9BACT|nr:hypothetical protein [Chitinophaga hostae]MBS0031612.1 hypothetical protein [Chitinophaga hostae]